MILRVPIFSVVERLTVNSIAKIGSGWHNPFAHHHSMRTEHHRATRLPFKAAIAITDVESEKEVLAHTTDLSLFGCFAETTTPFPPGTRVRLRINRGAEKITAQGKIAHARADEGMGIVFSKIEPDDQAILEKWLAGLRKV